MSKCKSITNWDNSEVKTLILIWGREDVKACLENTSKDPKTYGRITEELSDLGFDRNPNQVKEKMKSITKKHTKHVRIATAEVEVAASDFHFLTNWMRFWAIGRVSTRSQSLLLSRNLRPLP